MEFIIDNDTLAINKLLYSNMAYAEYDFEKSFLTPYGFFIPIQSSASIISRVLRGELELEDVKYPPDTDQYSSIMIDHHGMVYIITFCPNLGKIYHVRHTKGFFSSHMVNSSLTREDSSELYSYLLSDCETMEQAIQRTNSVSSKVFDNYDTYKISDLVARLKETKSTKIFAATSINVTKS